jgi:hypothetical protein
MKTTFFLLSLIIIAGCNPSVEIKSGMDPADVRADLEAIENVREQFQLAIKEGRYEDLNPLLARGAITIGPGSEDWASMYKRGQDRGMFPYDSIIMSPTETFILNDTMAYDWGYSNVYYTDEEGITVKLQDSFLVLLKKINGEWKLFREVSSSLVNE